MDGQLASVPAAVADEAGDVIDFLTCCGCYRNVHALPLDKIQHMANQLIRATVEEWQRAKSLQRMDLDQRLHDRLMSFILAVEEWMAGDATSLTFMDASMQAIICGLKLWSMSYIQHCKQCASSV